MFGVTSTSLNVQSSLMKHGLTHECCVWFIWGCTGGVSAIFFLITCLNLPVRLVQTPASAAHLSIRLLTPYGAVAGAPIRSAVALMYCHVGFVMQLFKTEGSSFHARNGALRKRMRKIPQVLRPQVAAPPIPLLCGCYDNQSDMQIETLCVVTMGMCSTEWYKDTDSLMPACVTQDPWCTWIGSRTESPKQNQQQWLSSSSSCHLWKSECHVFTGSDVQSKEALQ